MSWRYIATRFNGDGTETIVNPELPLRDCSFTTYRNAPTDLDGAIRPEVRNLKDEEGQPLLVKWATGIYAEKDGKIRAGGIFVDDAIDPTTGQLTIITMGLSGYPSGQPFTDGNSWPIFRNGVRGEYPAGGLEPMDAVRAIWDHLQSQPGGNIGLQIDPMNTGKRIGKVVAQGSYDTENGALSFEYEPFMLRDFETFDLGEKLSALHTNTPLAYRERHEWDEDGETILHYLDYGYPALGARRTDYRFVMGENVDFAGVDAPEEEYASVVLGLGAGEGAEMKRALIYRADEKRLRRAVAFEDKSAKTDAAINLSAQAELLSRIGVDEVTEIVARPGHAGRLAGLEAGDTVRLLGDTPYRTVDMWVTIQSKTESPDTETLTFGVNRSDRLA